MKFDDRLATILAAPISGAYDRAVRWRQLVDLVARFGPEADGPLFDAAVEAIRAGQRDISQPLRAAAARAIAGRRLPIALLAVFASDRLEVAAPLLTGGPPDPIVRDAASSEVRRFLDAMHPPAVSVVEALEAIETIEMPEVVPAPVEPPVAVDVPLPVDVETPTAVAEPSPVEPAAFGDQPLPTLDAVPSIIEAVERIERLRAVRAIFIPAVEEQQATPLPVDPAPVSAPMRTPAPPPAPTVSPPRPVPTPAMQSAIGPGSPALFRWECGPGGQIAWVEGAPRGPLVGRSIARADLDDGVDADVERAFSRRSPFRDATLAMPEAGLVAGRWLISGVPAFAPDDGRFVGYRGIARRAGAAPGDPPAYAPAGLDPAALRELVHEIKTPLNAIIGFAEIIDGQYLGPAQSGYRARAAEIVGQARILLGAIDDLDFAARLRSRESGEGDTTDLAAFFPPFAAWLKAEATARGVALAIDAPPAEGMCLLDRELSERLLDRFALAVLSAATPSETLRLAVRQDKGFCALRLSRPRALEGLSEGQMFGSEAAAASDLALRLVLGLAQIVGGELLADGGDLVLRMPIAR